MREPLSARPGIRASALAHRLVLLIIEPFGFLDSVGSRWLRELFRERPHRLSSSFTSASFLLWRMKRCFDVGGPRSSPIAVFLSPRFFFQFLIHSIFVGYRWARMIGQIGGALCDFRSY